jgi:hypothetical protein
MPMTAYESDGPKRWIGRFLMENLFAAARSSVALVVCMVISSCRQRKFRVIDQSI